MKFTYVHPGWEGSANDCRVLADARRSPSFPHPPPGCTPTLCLTMYHIDFFQVIYIINCDLLRVVGKYYVVDSGYSSQRGYLTPFKGDRYHLRDYRGTGRVRPVSN